MKACSRKAKGKEIRELDYLFAIHFFAINAFENRLREKACSKEVV
jgi:hypothetical protein